MTGSRLNSVANGGNFDGAAGVIAGLVAIPSLQRLGLRPHCDITTAAIRAEESVWFEVSYIGSRVGLRGPPRGSARSQARRHRPHPCGAHGRVRGRHRRRTEPARRAWTPNRSGHGSNCTSSRPRSWSKRACPLRSAPESRQLPLPAGEDPRRIRARWPPPPVSARRGAGGQRIRDRPRRHLEDGAMRQAGPWHSPSAASTRTRRSTR